MFQVTFFLKWYFLFQITIIKAFSPHFHHRHHQAHTTTKTSLFLTTKDWYFEKQQSKRSHCLSPLFVSELHVPGYAETKLPFVVSEQEICTLPPPRSYTAGIDYTSLIPYSDGHLLHKTTRPIFTAEECQRIVDEAEYVATVRKWTTNRHGNFPTTDLPIVELPHTLQFLRHALVERIYPLLSNQFGCYLPESNRLRVADGFVVKYDAANGQKELKPHRDGSVISFNIALNPATDFEGGGTWFASLDDAIKIDQGEIVSHASSLLHGGHGITSGKRYILVAFVIVEGYDNWSMRFYNQVRNY